MAGSRPTGEVPGQEALSGLARELHREVEPKGEVKPEDPAKVAFEARKARYNAIPVPKGLPQLPPSVLTERPTPLKMPKRRPAQNTVERTDRSVREPKGPDFAEQPLVLPEASQQQVQPLGDAALTLAVEENLGAAHVHAPMEPQPADRQLPPAEPQA